MYILLIQCIVVLGGSLRLRSRGLVSMSNSVVGMCPRRFVCMFNSVTGMPSRGLVFTSNSVIWCVLGASF